MVELTDAEALGIILRAREAELLKERRRRITRKFNRLAVAGGFSPTPTPLERGQAEIKRRLASLEDAQAVAIGLGELARKAVESVAQGFGDMVQRAVAAEAARKGQP